MWLKTIVILVFTLVALLLLVVLWQEFADKRARRKNEQASMSIRKIVQQSFAGALRSHGFDVDPNLVHVSLGIDGQLICQLESTIVACGDFYGSKDGGSILIRRVYSADSPQTVRTNIWHRFSPENSET